MRILRPLCLKGLSRCLLTAVLLSIGHLAGQPMVGQGHEGLTPIQREVERQRQRLNSADIEERRDALMRLGSFKRPAASRAAAAGLSDLAPIVRVTAAHAILSLPPAESASLLMPLLQDKLEFVRREAAYALGQTRSPTAVSPLINLLTVDKDAGVRGAAAAALGEIGDRAAVPALMQVLTGQTENKKKAKTAENAFVMRAAARSLGQLRSRSAVAVLITALAADTNDIDLRREAATALGLIGDPSAAPALSAAVASGDPYLSDAARNALRRTRVTPN